MKLRSFVRFWSAQEMVISFHIRISLFLIWYIQLCNILELLCAYYAKSNRSLILKVRDTLHRRTVAGEMEGFVEKMRLDAGILR